MHKLLIKYCILIKHLLHMPRRETCYTPTCSCRELGQCSCSLAAIFASEESFHCYVLLDIMMLRNASLSLFLCCVLALHTNCSTVKNNWWNKTWPVNHYRNGSSFPVLWASYFSFCLKNVTLCAEWDVTLYTSHYCHQWVSVIHQTFSSCTTWWSPSIDNALYNLMST